jgi:hypothetical protein
MVGAAVVVSARSQDGHPPQFFESLTVTER